MPNKLPIDLPEATPGTKYVHGVNVDDLTDGPQGTSQKVAIVPITRDTLITQFSTAISQEPSSLDTPIRIEFGPAFGTAIDPVELDATGLFTVNVTGSYFIKTIVHYGRTTSAGAVELFFRLLINGVQLGNSAFSRLDDDDTVMPSSNESFIFFTAGDTFEFELIRDSSNGGINNGGLFQGDPSTGGWSNSQTAAIAISRFVGNSAVIPDDSESFVTSSSVAPTFEDARFFSELGLADTQTPPWTITANTPATVSIVNESVLGIFQDVHKLSDDGGGIATVALPLSLSDWTSYFNLDASYGGILRLDSTDGDSGCFWGLGALSVDTPDNPGTKRRFGLNFTKSLTTTELRVAGTDGNALDVDVPGSAFDEYNEITLKITRGTPPTAEVFVNGNLIGSLTFNTHTGGTATEVSWSSGSSGGTNRVTYMSNFGITKYTSDNTILIGDELLNVDLTKTLLPPGRRDYIATIAESVTGAKAGAKFEFIGLNRGGTVTVNNENPSNPKALFSVGFNNLKEVVIPVPFDSILQITGVNSVEGGNVYNFKL